MVLRAIVKRQTPSNLSCGQSSNTTIHQNGIQFPKILGKVGCHSRGNSVCLDILEYSSEHGKYLKQLKQLKHELGVLVHRARDDNHEPRHTSKYTNALANDSNHHNHHNNNSNNINNNKYNNKGNGNNNYYREYLRLSE